VAITRRSTLVSEQLAADSLEARVQVGLAAYERAQADGLCDEGAWECALGAMRNPRRLLGIDDQSLSPQPVCNRLAPAEPVGFSRRRADQRRATVSRLIC
jgi:hypothetical protein